MPRIKNLKARQNWVQQTLESIPAGSRILDVGAGECQYKQYCSHLNYLSQDIAQYDGKGNRKGLQTQHFDRTQLDFVCDLYDIPEDELFDAVLCTEVLEHVVDPVRAVEKLTRLVKPEGLLIITAPFVSWTHFAPYHYATGFSEYFYNEQMSNHGFEIVELQPNGGFFDVMDQEIGRVGSVRRRYGGMFIDPISFVCLTAARMSVRIMAALDGPRDKRRSSELATFGWHMKAVRRAA
ncbi:class I SAM-dependent methyltransferase [Neorhodopirellula pilleata]|uniref:Bifunctional 3-demethylubiquinone-9 3-methyltransferase/ 2-octaprenyl-6-hydroxy phenol methylase n=1 Tax=Neorhodopirellula pilleata TaxID=2714738 RepID=A0A5C6A9A0_9BACT|nr:class I SAM-dependent methyltransferase [Neorhodopirellula pilleata]TWT95621.1 bifunctional 3-demethylubiquinone-9 3-methyltransferase/ 2-octaprenyl-6-hydroxy phenol methylase [Neorhodopirellula pilleata]